MALNLDFPLIVYGDVYPVLEGTGDNTGFELTTGGVVYPLVYSVSTIHLAYATMDGDGNILSAGVLILGASAPDDSNGSLTATGAVIRDAVASGDADGNFAVDDPLVVHNASADIDGAADSTMVAYASLVGTTFLDSNGSVSASAVVDYEALLAPLQADTSFDAPAVIAYAALASIEGEGSLDGAASVEHQAASDLTSEAESTATSRVLRPGVADSTAEAELAADALLDKSAVAQLAASTDIDAIAIADVPGASLVASTGTVDALGSVTWAADASVDADSDTNAAPGVIFTSTFDWSEEFALAASGARIFSMSPAPNAVGDVIARALVEEMHILAIPAVLKPLGLQIALAGKACQPLLKQLQPVPILRYLDEQPKVTAHKDDPVLLHRSLG